MQSQKQSTPTSPNFIPKLTALWAVSESGLGGILHALQIPVSGLLLGSFAVIIITFIALNSQNRWKDIIQATLIVVLIKAIASPHSPFTAYVAVFFQGIMGALIYSLLPPRRLSAIAFGILALLESAFQKILVLVLVFGSSIWLAFEEFFKGLAKQFNMLSIESLPEVFLSVYFLIYLIAGIAAGLFAIRIPKLVQEEWHYISTHPQPEPLSEEVSNKRKRKQRIYLFFGLLLFIVAVFLFTNSEQKALYVLLRTFGAIAILYFIINPLFMYFLNRWKNRSSTKENKQFQDVLELLPEIKSNAKQAQNYAALEPTNYKKAKRFILAWMALSLNSSK